MTTITEQIVSCGLCGGTKRLTKVDNQEFDYGEWTYYTVDVGQGQRNKYICPHCKGAIKGLFAEFISEWEEKNKDKRQKNEKK